MNAACLFVFSQQRRQHAPCSNVIPEFEPITDDFVDTEVQRDGPNGEIECPRDENVPIAEISCRIDEDLRLRKNRRFQGDFEQIVGQADQPVAMHSAIRAKRKDVEEGARVQIQPEKEWNAQQDLGELIGAFDKRTVIAGIVRVHRDQIA